MKRMLVFAIAGVACFLFVGCAQDDTNSTAMDLSTNATVPAPVQPNESQGGEHHVTADLVPVDNSGITGHVTVESLPHGGVNISIVAFGLAPGEEYLSLYYDNHTCELEPYEEDDVIGEYTANPAGVGKASNKLEDDLDEVNSISVRLASDFSLLSCADIHP